MVTEVPQAALLARNRKPAGTAASTMINLKLSGIWEWSGRVCLGGLLWVGGGEAVGAEVPDLVRVDGVALDVGGAAGPRDEHDRGGQRQAHTSQ